MEGFQIRRAIPDKDYEQLAVLLSQIWSDPVSSDGLREWDTTEDGRSMNRRMVLVDAAEKVVGYSSVFREGSAENGRYDIWVCVKSNYRCQGFGAKLYDEALQFVLEQGATVLNTECQQNLVTSTKSFPKSQRMYTPRAHDRIPLS